MTALDRLQSSDKAKNPNTIIFRREKSELLSIKADQLDGEEALSDHANCLL
jgi:hypothetical protein